MERFITDVESVASGTNKTLITVFHAAAAPTCRGAIAEIVMGGSGTPQDHSANLFANRITAVGTEGSGLVPNNRDPAGPAGEMDSGLGVFGAEPTYTAAKQLLLVNLHHRGTYRHVCRDGWEFLMTATQNNGMGLKTLSSSSTQSYGATVMFEE